MWEHPFLDLLDDASRAAVVEQLQEIRVRSGKVLFRSGDTPDALYLVARGCIDLTTGKDHLVAQALAGDTVGETGALTGEPRSATATATQPTTVLRLETDALHRLLPVHSGIALAAGRLLGQKLLATNRRLERDHRGTTIVVICSRRARELVVAMSALAGAIGVLGLDGRAGAGTRRVSRERVLELLSSTDRRLRGLPVVCVVVGEDRDRFAETLAPAADWVITDASPPAWLERVTSRTLRVRDAPSVRRAARFATGNAVALVLSSGGSKTVAHVGVIDTLLADEVPIDLVVGSSGGSFVAAGLAMGMPVPQMVERARALGEVLSLRRLGVRAVPRTALTKGRHLREVLGEWFGDTPMESLPIGLAMVATDAVTGEHVVLDRGPIADAIRASIAIPAVLDPWQIDGRWLTDGAVVDPLPIGLARAMGAPRVIASCVAGRQGPRAAPTNGPPQLAQLLSTVISASERERVAHSAGAADLLIQPDVSATSSFDFTDVEGFVDAGRKAAAEALAAVGGWQ